MLTATVSNFIFKSKVIEFHTVGTDNRRCTASIAGVDQIMMIDITRIITALCTPLVKKELWLGGIYL